MSVKRSKKYGLYQIEATIKELSTEQYKNRKKQKILIIKEKLKSEMLKKRITIEKIKNLSEIDKLSINKKIKIYINPYYELAFAKTLKTFPINTENLEARKWLKNFEYYLTLNMMFWHDYHSILKSTKDCSYTTKEVYLFMDVLLEYYDLENPQKNVIEKDSKYIYYNIKKNLIEDLQKDIEEYEKALVSKSIVEKKSFEDIKNEVNFTEERYNIIKENLLVNQEKRE